MPLMGYVLDRVLLANPKVLEGPFTGIPTPKD
jgi:hypothetical protein